MSPNTIVYIKCNALAVTTAILFSMVGRLTADGSFHEWYIWIPLGVLGFYVMDMYGKLRFGKK